MTQAAKTGLQLPRKPAHTEEKTPLTGKRKTSFLKRGEITPKRLKTIPQDEIQLSLAGGIICSLNSSDWSTKKLYKLKLTVQQVKLPKRENMDPKQKQYCGGMSPKKQ